MSTTIEQRLDFREKTHVIFTKIQSQFGIQPKIALMQSAEESNWGLSQLATEGMNIFSITPGSTWINFKNGTTPQQDVPRWSSLGIETVHYPATEYSKYPPEKIRYWEFRGDVIEKRPDGKGGSVLKVDRHFRKYSCWEESAWDWARKIAQTPIYKFALEAARTGDMFAYAGSIARAGYATDGSYTDQLLRVGRVITALPEVA